MIYEVPVGDNRIAVIETKDERDVSLPWFPGGVVRTCKAMRILEMYQFKKCDDRGSETDE